MTPLLLAAMLATAAPQPLLPGVVDSPASEIRPAFSPDGRCILWGLVAGADQDWQILQTCRDGDTWSKPEPVSFDSGSNDFDPAFSPDGKTVYFFSNRPGGLGEDDIYAVDHDPVTGAFGQPRNLGPHINTAKNEWAPTPLATGELLFSSDGWPGQGAQDLFIGDGKSDPRNLGAPVNTAQDEFDAVVLADGTLVLTAGHLKNDGPARLLAAARLPGGGYAAPEPLTAPFNCSNAFNNGPGVDPNRPDLLFYSAYCPETGPGRMDIFSAPYSNGIEAPK